MSTKEVKYKVIRDRVETYQDFTINLIYCLEKYYLDEKTLSLDTDIYNHFKFCYKKTCEMFLLESINFNDNNDLFNYFYHYFYHNLYKNDLKLNFDFIKLKEFWREVFDVDNQKTKKTFNILTELYSYFDQSFQKNKNILEEVE